MCPGCICVHDKCCLQLNIPLDNSCYFCLWLYHHHHITISILLKWKFTSIHTNQRGTKINGALLELVPHFLVIYSYRICTFVYFVIFTILVCPYIHNVHLYILSFLPFLYVLTSIMSICTFCHFYHPCMSLHPFSFFL